MLVCNLFFVTFLGLDYIISSFKPAIEFQLIYIFNLSHSVIFCIYLQLLKLKQWRHQSRQTTACGCA